MTLGLAYYDKGAHSYGFRLNLPTFQSTNQVFLACNVYMCDRVLDVKPYCDRTCTDPMPEDGISRNEQVFIPSRQKRSASRTEPSGNGGSFSTVSSGRFVVNDPGFGPMIMDDGTIKIIPPGKLHWGHALRSLSFVRSLNFLLKFKSSCQMLKFIKGYFDS